MGTEAVSILLIEDNAADIYLFRKALEDAELNAELTVIDDGAEAMAWARGEGEYAGSAAPDLAVLDLNLPKNHGVEVLEALRQNARLAGVPVVIASSSTAPPGMVQPEELRVARYIVKPADLEGFLAIGVVLKEVLRESGRGPLRGI